MLWGNEGVMKTASRELRLDYKVPFFPSGFGIMYLRIERVM